MPRTADISRRTKETEIILELSLEGGEIDIDTGIGFFDHMLRTLAFYSGFGMKLKAAGDLSVDGHHTVEDVGIVLGGGIKQALGDKAGIRRFSSCYIPMDEALGFAALDISGRAYLVFDANMPQATIGQYDACLTEEFMRALAMNGGMTLHLRSLYGANAHHITEALFKALGMSLKQAVEVSGSGVASTKGALE